MKLVELMVQYHTPSNDFNGEPLFLNPALVAAILPAEQAGWSYVQLVPGLEIAGHNKFFYVRMEPAQLARKLAATEP